jgi:hypothetical protein
MYTTSKHLENYLRNNGLTMPHLVEEMKWASPEEEISLTACLMSERLGVDVELCLDVVDGCVGDDDEIIFSKVEREIIEWASMPA